MFICLFACLLIRYDCFAGNCAILGRDNHAEKLVSCFESSLGDEVMLHKLQSICNRAEIVSKTSYQLGKFGWLHDLFGDATSSESIGLLSNWLSELSRPQLNQLSFDLQLPRTEGVHINLYGTQRNILPSYVTLESIDRVGSHELLMMHIFSAGHRNRVEVLFGIFSEIAY